MVIIMEKEKEMVYLFQFQSYNTPKSIDLVHQVYTDDIHLMKLFLRQHKFNDAEKYVKYVDKNAYDVDTDGIEELGVFRLRSNKSKNVVNVVTSHHFIEEATLEVCQKMSMESIFGNLITENLSVIKDIRDTISSLPYGAILDIGTDEYDELNVKPRDPDPETYYILSSISSFEEWKYCMHPSDELEIDVDDAYVYDSICEECTAAMMYEEILPITIEAYSEYFISLLTDDYNT
jgi:hypothetical protein